MDEVKEECCRDCKFFVSERYNSGNCHRFPPQVMDEDYGLIFSYVSAYSWCGEFVKGPPKIDPSGI